jgi:hypothetical protein
MIETLESVFPQWKNICLAYDLICDALVGHYDSTEEASRKEESIHWEQTALELLITLLIRLNIPFRTSADRIQKVIKTLDGTDKEVDFSISIGDKDIYFGITSFSDSEKDFAKDVAAVDIPITNLKRSDGTTSNTARITSMRSHESYMSRRLVVRVATEGKHRLPSDYIYVAFPKIAPGFGKGLDAIGNDFSFDDSEYNYPENGITGLIVIGEHLDMKQQHKSIEHDIWLVRAKAFSHGSDTARNVLKQLDGITINMRPKFQAVRRLLAQTSPA